MIPPGCAFHPRCNDARLPSPCQTDRPELREIDADHLSACHFAEELPTLSTSELSADESGEAPVD
jgi:hypothetical protein